MMILLFFDFVDLVDNLIVFVWVILGIEIVFGGIFIWVLIFSWKIVVFNWILFFDFKLYLGNCIFVVVLDLYFVWSFLIFLLLI